MQIRNIHRLIQDFPAQLGRYASDPLRSAQRVDVAPYFVAGYFTDVIQHLAKNTKPDYVGGIDWAKIKRNWSEGDLNAALIHSYNPDPGQIGYVNTHLKIIHDRHQH